MKKISYFLMLLFTVGLVSCTDDDNDPLTGSENVGGLLNTVTSDLIYAQGSPATDMLTASFKAFHGRESVETVDVYKQFFSVETVDGVQVITPSNRELLTTLTFPRVDQMETIEYSFTYPDLIAGLSVDGTPLPADDATLHIGDYWELSYLAHSSNGTAHLSNDVTKVTVSCGSFLEATYSNVTTRADNPALVYTFANDVVSKIGDGKYLTSYIGPYYCPGQAAGSANTIQLPAGTRAGYEFSDVCGDLSMETQNLANAFSNEVRQSAAQRALSHADPVTGVITIHYSIMFTNNTVERPYITTLTPQ